MTIATFTIEKGLPVPAAKWGVTVMSPTTATIRALEVGDSFFIPEKKNVALTGEQKKLGRKFVSRRQDGGVRVWRLA